MLTLLAFNAACLATVAAFARWNTVRLNDDGTRRQAPTWRQHVVPVAEETVPV